MYSSPMIDATSVPPRFAKHKNLMSTVVVSALPLLYENLLALGECHWTLFCLPSLLTSFAEVNDRLIVRTRLAAVKASSPRQSSMAK
jgi:hypothetical protein